MITTDTKSSRRWMASILQSVADPIPTRQFGQVAEKPLQRRSAATKGFAMRLKAVTRPEARAAG